MKPSRRLVLAFALGSGLALVGCDFFRPKPPKLTPRSAEITQVTSAGLGIRVHLTANNPNRVDLSVQNIDVRTTLAGRDLGRSRIANTTRLPSHQDVPLSIELLAPWQDLPGILVATALNENVPYHLSGTVRVGGERINLDVPFEVDSTLPRQILVNAAGNSLPNLPTIVR